jgi:hypothetical protein
MPFREDTIRFERFYAEMTYHSAYNYLSLKGVLAERWAHGPLFGAFSEAGAQITLTAAGEPGGPPPRPVQAFYGLKASGFVYERLPRNELSDVTDDAVSWISDVYTVLSPRRVIGTQVQWFLLHPIDNAERSSRLLRDRYYNATNSARLKPSRYGSYHSAVENVVTQGPEMYTVVLGVVGPPHKGQFFSSDDPERDARWWMGLRIAFSFKDEDGIDDPVDRMREMVSQATTDVLDLARIGFNGVID